MRRNDTNVGRNGTSARTMTKWPNEWPMVFLKNASKSHFLALYYYNLERAPKLKVAR